MSTLEPTNAFDPTQDQQRDALDLLGLDEWDEWDDAPDLTTQTEEEFLADIKLVLFRHENEPNSTSLIDIMRILNDGRAEGTITSFNFSIDEDDIITVEYWGKNDDPNHDSPVIVVSDEIDSLSIRFSETYTELDTFDTMSGMDWGLNVDDEDEEDFERLAIAYDTARTERAYLNIMFRDDEDVPRERDAATDVLIDIEENFDALHRVLEAAQNTMTQDEYTSLVHCVRASLQEGRFQMLYPMVQNTEPESES